MSKASLGSQNYCDKGQLLRGPGTSEAVGSRGDSEKRVCCPSGVTASQLQDQLCVGAGVLDK